jgi:hypothetical protein
VKNPFNHAQNPGVLWYKMPRTGKHLKSTIN